MIKRILVGLSGTAFTPSAIQHAVDLARLHDASLTGVTLVDLGRLANVGPIPMGGGAAASEIIEHRLAVTEQRVRQTIEQFERACREARIPHQVCQETGDPFTQLMARWRYHDLTIFGLRGLFEYGVVHNPDDQVIRLIARGVRPIIAVGEEFRLIRRVMIAYNGSMESANTMKRFAQLQLWSDMTIRIVYCNRERPCPSLLDDARAYCADHGLNVETEYIQARPTESLLEHAADWQADMIALGSTARARLFRHMMGDTALHLIRNAHLPLFLGQ